jgi:DNA primase
VIDARVPLKKAGKDYKACCPFHDEKTPSFTVSASKQFYHCFGCGAHGTAIGFLMEHERMSFPEAVAELAGQAGLKVPEEAAAAAPKTETSAQLLSVLADAARFYRGQLREYPAAIEYLKRRGLTGEIAAEFGLGFAPDGWDHLVRALGATASQQELLVQAGLAARRDGGGVYDRFRGRVIFPIHDYRGRIVGFGGRIIDKGEPKYLNSPETPLFQKGRELYGLYRARDAIRREGLVLIVEGYMDVVALAQNGVDYAVATLGTATTRDHLERIYRFAPHVVFCFDGDRAGREAAHRALDTALAVLHEGRQASFLFLPEGEDPDTLVRKEGGDGFRDRLKQAVPLPEFFFQVLAAEVDLGRLDGRARLVELAKPLLSKLPTGVFRQLMWERLAVISGVAVKDGETSAAAGARPAMRPGSPDRPPSMMRAALGLLVQHPELVRHVPDRKAFQSLEQPGLELFYSMVELLQASPHLNTAAVVEHFRGTPDEQAIAKLAAWDHAVVQGDADAQFVGVIGQMRRAAAAASADRLLRKPDLSAAEKAELARLLAEKSRTGAMPR